MSGYTGEGASKPKVDKHGQGGRGVRKLAKLCGYPLWMAPDKDVY